MTSGVTGKLENRVAIVTGAGSGIGKATSRLFASEGAKVVVVTHSDRGEGAAEEIRREGGEATFLRCDIADAEQVEEMIDAAVDRYGGIDILVNNAARNRADPPVVELVDQLDLAEWSATIQTNLTGCFLCSKFALRHMLPMHRGAIVNVASSAGVQATPRASAYAASKAGVVALTKCMALDYGPSGIRVNAVLPLIKTERTGSFWEAKPEKLDEYLTEVPMGRLGVPQEAAAGILFLASDDASYVSGELLAIDGGRVALR